jgi:peptidoglycan/LPS O-acetylase OafA/YrhL
MTHIYYASVCRFDELLPGVALALLREAHPQAWRRATAHGRLTLALGLGWTIAVLAWFHLGHESAAGGFAFGPSVFGYPALAAGFAVLTLSALSPGSPLHRLRLPGAATLAVASYALYLVHKPVFSAARPLLAALSLDARQPAGVLLLIALSLVAAAALHLLVERPFLRWRDRHLPARAPEAGTPLALKPENRPLPQA